MEIHCWVTMTPTPKAIATSSRVWPSFGPCAHATPGNQGSEVKKGTFRNWCWIQLEPFFFFRGKVILHLTPLCLSFEKRAYALFSLWQKKTMDFNHDIWDFNSECRGASSPSDVIEHWWQVTIFHSICSFAPPYEGMSNKQQLNQGLVFLN